MDKEIYLVSSCLAGVKCRWDGQVRDIHPKIEQLIKERRAILVCAEQLGGLSTPRDPAERNKDKVITNKGNDVTESFKKGAEEVLKIARLYNCKKAILKSKSPSCGFRKIYDGTFTKTLIDENGVLAQLLLDNGFEIYTENELDKI